MTPDSDTTTGDESEVTNLEIVEQLQISEEAADEIASELTDDLGLIRDLTYTGEYFIVRWNDTEEA